LKTTERLMMYLAKLSGRQRPANGVAGTFISMHEIE
jgi:hypothetical protein